MLDERVWEGVESLLNHYAAVQAGDLAVVIYSSDSAGPAIWVSAALESMGIPVRRVWMSPLVDAGFAERAAAALPDPADLAGDLAVFTFERDTMSHTTDLARLLSRYDKHRCRVFRAISACEDLFSTALQVRPDELSGRNIALLERLMGARAIEITTRGGSQLDIELDSTRHRWISNRGISKAGGVVVLPAGEVATYPANVNGVLVADFAFNVNAITDRDTRLSEHPVTVRIENGRATSYECADAPTKRFLDQCFETHCAYNVGELGLGTNTMVKAPIFLNSHINERRPGVHLGFGQHNQDPGVVGYQCAIHLDLVADGGIIRFKDGSPEIDLEDVAPSMSAHPLSTRDEDVFSPESYDLEIDDCCGILTKDGLSLVDFKDCS